MWTGVIDAVFGQFGVAATYTPDRAGADGVPVTVVPSRADEDMTMPGGMATARRGVFEIRAADLTPVRGSFLTTGSERWRINGPPKKIDQDGLIWTVFCEPVP